MAHELSALIRAALFVRDLDRSIRFYKALGFDAVYFEGMLDGPSAATVLAVPPTSKVRCCILKRADGPNFGMVGLFEVTEPVPEALPLSAGPPRIGEVALVIYAKPITEAIIACRAAGATWAPDAILFNMPHRQQMESCLRDPDGVLINLVERDPAEQNRTQPVVL
ncbi:VOC family protein [Niveispirillum irakense]|uniref:VOC family protein n=1 Tax=Niveispirillum irakense TaxID=34011 RepID=UPI000413BAAD|nr:VOC family protein [Niveispirillum irakense]